MQHTGSGYVRKEYLRRVDAEVRGRGEREFSALAVRCYVRHAPGGWSGPVSMEERDLSTDRSLRDSGGGVGNHCFGVPTTYRHSLNRPRRVVRELRHRRRSTSRRRSRIRSQSTSDMSRGFARLRRLPEQVPDHRPLAGLTRIGQRGKRNRPAVGGKAGRITWPDAYALRGAGRRAGARIDGKGPYEICLASFGCARIGNAITLRGYLDVVVVAMRDDRRLLCSQVIRGDAVAGAVDDHSSVRHPGTRNRRKPPEWSRSP